MYSTGFPIEWISTAVPGTEVGAVCEDEHTAPAFRVPQSLGLGSCLLQSTREDLKPSSLGPFITSPQHVVGSVIWHRMLPCPGLAQEELQLISPEGQVPSLALKTLCGL